MAIQLTSLCQEKRLPEYPRWEFGLPGSGNHSIHRAGFAPLIPSIRLNGRLPANISCLQGWCPLQAGAQHSIGAPPRCLMPRDNPHLKIVVSALGK